MPNNKIKILSEQEVAKIMMLIGSLFDLSERERLSKQHDVNMSLHLKDIAEKLQATILPDFKNEKPNEPTNPDMPFTDFYKAKKINEG